MTFLNCKSERIPGRFCLTAVLRGLQGTFKSHDAPRFLQNPTVSIPDRLHQFRGLRLASSPGEEKRVEAERRKFRRLLPQKLTFAVLRPHFARLGKVKDISEGGLAFEYIRNETQNPGSSEIDIFLSGDRFYLPRLPCKIVYDVEIVEEYQSLRKRRCGVQFGDLTEVQAIELDSFLENYTTGTA